MLSKLQTLLKEKEYEQVILDATDFLKAEMSLGEKIETSVILGIAHYRVGNYEESKELLESTLECISTQNGFPRFEAQTRYWLGRSLVKLGDTVSAKEHYSIALDISYREDDSKMTLSVANSLALIYHRRGYPEEAISILERAVNRFPDGSSFLLSLCYNSLGSFHRAVGNNDAAIDAYLKSKELSVDDPIGISIALNNIANVYLQIGKIDEAYYHYEECLTVSRDANDLEGVAFVLRNMAELHCERGEFQEAERMYRDSIETFKQTSLPPVEALIGLGQLMTRLEQPTRLLDILQNMEVYQSYIDQNFTYLVKLEILRIEYAKSVLDYDTARKLLKSILSDERTSSHIVEYLYLMTLSAEIALKDGKITLTKNILSEASVQAAEKQLFAVQWNIQRVLLLVHILDRNLEQAETLVGQLKLQAKSHGFLDLMDDAKSLEMRIFGLQAASRGYDHADMIVSEDEHIEVSSKEINNYIAFVKTLLSKFAEK